MFSWLSASEGLKDRVVSVQKEIGKWPLNCKLVERGNLHLCFSFLGEVDEKNMGEISRKIDELSKHFKKFEVLIRGLRAIPDENYIRVIAMDVVDETGMLKSFFGELVREVGGDSKPAHLTLCRVKSVLDKNLVKERIEEGRQEKYGTLSINSIQLIKSELSRSGPIYSVVHEAPLLD